MITRILGLPDSDIEQLKSWSAAWVLPFSGGLTEEQEVWVAEQVVAGRRVFLRLKCEDSSDCGVVLF